MNTRSARHQSSFSFLLSALCLVSLFAVTHIATIDAAPPNPKPDAAASREAFLQVYKVFTSPRCQNCHPSGDSPLQGDDSHAHMQNVVRGESGHGVYGMRCNTCHQIANVPANTCLPEIPSGPFRPRTTKWFSSDAPLRNCVASLKIQNKPAAAASRNCSSMSPPTI